MLMEWKKDSLSGFEDGSGEDSLFSSYLRPCVKKSPFCFFLSKGDVMLVMPPTTESSDSICSRHPLRAGRRVRSMSSLIVPVLISSLIRRRVYCSTGNSALKRGNVYGISPSVDYNLLRRYKIFGAKVNELDYAGDIINLAERFRLQGSILFRSSRVRSMSLKQKDVVEDNTRGYG